MSTFSAETLAAQALGLEDHTTRAVVPPLHLSTTYIRDADNGYSSGYVYGRPDNATIKQAEGVIAALEEAREALVFASGMASATAVFLAQPPGAHVVAPTVMYWALRNWLINDYTAIGYRVTLVDTGDLNAVAKAVATTGTTLVWLETPANPLWSIADIASIAAIAHKVGARVGVDSTCATPVLSRPLTLGADIVMHAATKYLNGHSDVVAGALATKAPDDPLWQKIRRIRAIQGGILGPFEAYLLLRGMRTLHVRVKAQCTAAMALAERLQGHANVNAVLYPGLANSPGHALAAKQMQGGFGGMLSIRVRSGEAAAVRTAAHVRLWKRATSLGGVESLIEHRASIEGVGSPCPTDLLRLSVGLESVDDLYADLNAALNAAAS